MIRNKLQHQLSIAICSLMSSTTVLAYPFLYSGVQQIANSGMNVIGSGDATATVGNPANLSDSEKTASYGDVSIVSLQYVYAHTNYDPVYLRTVAPPVNFGLNLRAMDGLNFGLLISPRSAPGAKPMRIKGVPTYTGAGYALFDLDVRQSGFQGGFGLGYKDSGSPWALGLAVIYGEDGQEITAYASESDKSVPGMDMLYSGRSYQALVGLRYLSDRSTLGFTYKSASIRHYDGDIASAVTDNIYEHYRGVSYQPAQIALAFERRQSDVTFSTQITEDFWSKGRRIANRGLPYASPETDFKDSFGVALAAKYHQSDDTTWTASSAHYTANTGDGTPIDLGSTALDDSAIPAQTGMEFGQMEAISRSVFGLGIARRRLDNSGYWMFSGNYQTGTRTIPVGHKGEGWYHIDVFTLAAGMSLKF